MTFTHLLAVLRLPDNMQFRINSVKFSLTMFAQSICCIYISTTMSCMPFAGAVMPPLKLAFECRCDRPPAVVDASDFGDRKRVIRIDIIQSRISRAIFFSIVDSALDAIFSNTMSKVFDSSMATRCCLSFGILYTGFVLRMLIEISCSQSQPVIQVMV